MRKFMRKTMTCVVCAVAACSDSPVNPPAQPSAAQVSGVYNLTRVDAATLPFVAFEYSTYRVSITSGKFDLNANGSYWSEVRLRTDDAGNVRQSADTSVGTWVLRGDSVILTNAAGSLVRPGKIIGGTILMQSSDRSFEMKK